MPFRMKKELKKRKAIMKIIRRIKNERGERPREDWIEKIKKRLIKQFSDENRIRAKVLHFAHSCFVKYIYTLTNFK